jgi:hypothetical protein
MADTLTTITGTVTTIATARCGTPARSTCMICCKMVTSSRTRPTSMCCEKRRHTACWYVPRAWLACVSKNSSCHGCSQGPGLSKSAHVACIYVGLFTDMDSPTFDTQMKVYVLFILKYTCPLLDKHAHGSGGRLTAQQTMAWTSMIHRHSHSPASFVISHGSSAAQYHITQTIHRHSYPCPDGLTERRAASSQAALPC